MIRQPAPFKDLSYYRLVLIIYSPSNDDAGEKVVRTLATCHLVGDRTVKLDDSAPDCAVGLHKEGEGIVPVVEAQVAMLPVRPR